MSSDLRVVTFMRAKPGQERTVRNAILGCAIPSRNEAGNLSYNAHVDDKDSLLFVVVEHWASLEARAKLESEHFRTLERVADDEGRLSEHFFHALQPISD